jgi:hypothetical protein
MPLCAHVMCMFFSVCSITWVLFTGNWFSCEKFLLLSSSISTLYFFKVWVLSPSVPCESLERILLRKQIQAANWKIMFHRAMYSALVLDSSRQRRQNIMKNSPKKDTHTTHTRYQLADARRWKSWNESTESTNPNFDADDCRNSEIKRMISV